MLNVHAAETPLFGAPCTRAVGAGGARALPRPRATPVRVRAQAVVGPLEEWRSEEHMGRFRTEDWLRLGLYRLLGPILSQDWRCLGAHPSKNCKRPSSSNCHGRGAERLPGKSSTISDCTRNKICYRAARMRVRRAPKVTQLPLTDPCVLSQSIALGDGEKKARPKNRNPNFQPPSPRNWSPEHRRTEASARLDVLHRPRARRAKGQRPGRGLLQTILLGRGLVVDHGPHLPARIRTQLETDASRLRLHSLQSFLPQLLAQRAIASAPESCCRIPTSTRNVTTQLLQFC